MSSELKKKFPDDRFDNSPHFGLWVSDDVDDDGVACVEDTIISARFVRLDIDRFRFCADDVVEV